MQAGFIERAAFGNMLPAVERPQDFFFGVGKHIQLDQIKSNIALKDLWAILYDANGKLCYKRYGDGS